MKRTEKNTQWHMRVILLLAGDIIAIMLSSFLALWLRFELVFADIDRIFLESIYQYAVINIICTIAIFYAFHLYTSLWKYASVNELVNITLAVVISGIVNAVGMRAFQNPVPRSYDILYTMFLLAMMIGIRFFYRFVRFMKTEYFIRNRKEMSNVMVIGAGDAGAAIVKELRLNETLKRRVCCMIDDDPAKKGKYVQGCLVVGGKKDIISAVERYGITQIIIAMPSAPKSTIKEIVDLCQHTECKIRILPGMYQLVSGEVSVSQLRDVEIGDLLGREQIKVNLNEILGYVQNKVVLVTGGGGSIGSEICRQLAGHGVKQLIIVDIYENNIYEIQQELKRKYPELDLVALIASVRNTHRIDEIMGKYRPNVVYHAAAHKHVPLMEDNPNEAIKNNVFGTYKTASAAGKHGVERFVLISTDKAVNPTNIMGASKRMCEMIVQTLDKFYPTEFVAVRFGNVLGSNGSVIPLFKKQIAEGGPVTVTHPDIIRYFMTIPEAVSLVLQAGAYAKGGEIFVLDMGEPVKIADLAKNLIRFSGFKVGEDIEIKYTGLRPGEKLYEELLMDEEGLQATDNNLIHIGKPIDMNEAVFMRQLKELKAASDKDSELIRQMVKEMVPTYVMKEE
ncbi:nucleoside-diphosphate sugar epimerase/dehydratase [Faecalimonas hominis]